MAKIIYNVTVIIDDSVGEEWLIWMKDKHIPDLMGTGYFLSYTFTKILAESEGGTSYSIQYLCSSMEDLNEYQEKSAPAFQKEHSEKYQGKFAAFRTLLEVI